MTAAEITKQFVAKWVPAPTFAGDASSNLARLEAQFGLRFPKAYREFVALYGTPSPRGVLESIVAGQHSIPDIQEFLSLDEIQNTTRMYESGGMPVGFVAFASDCMGNLFLFKIEECQNAKEDVPVWFFDHDFVTVETEADSFLALLERYVSISVTRG